MNKRRDRLFFCAMALLYCVVAVAGFFPNSVAILRGEMPNPAWPVHVHAFFMACWLLLLAAQALLVTAGKQQWHFRLGRAAAVVAPAVIVMMIAMAVYSFPGGDQAAATVVVQLRRILVFSTCIAWAMAVRRTRPDTHKRLILLATIVVMDAAFFRLGWALPSFGLTNIVAFGHFYQFVLLVPLLAYDLLVRRKLDVSLLVVVPVMYLFTGLSLWLW